MHRKATAVSKKRTKDNALDDQVVVLAARPGSRKEAMLDAAEELFSNAGYHGATLREITKAAGVELGLANYHFGSKDELFRQVIGRRAEEICDALHLSLDQAIAEAGKAPPNCAAIIEAYVAPHRDRLLKGGRGWQNYLRLVYQSLPLENRELLLEPIVRIYPRVYDRYLAGFKRALPGRSQRRIANAFHFLRLAIVGLTGEPQYTLHSNISPRVEEAFPDMVPFFADGFERMCEGN